MKFDVRLCEEYLGMPAEHWELAQTAVDWINRDSLAEEMVCNALSALASGDRRHRHPLQCGTAAVQNLFLR